MNKKKMLKMKLKI